MMLIWQVSFCQGQSGYRKPHHHRKPVNRKKAFYNCPPVKSLCWSKMPRGSVCLDPGGNSFFYDGRFFQPKSAYFISFIPAPGFFIPFLPGPYLIVRFQGRLFHCVNGSFYRKAPGGFVCVSPPIGICIPSLPPGETELLEHDGLFRFRNQIWKEVGSGEGFAYELIGLYPG